MNFKNRINYLGILTISIITFSCKTTTKTTIAPTATSTKHKTIADSVATKHNFTNSETIYNSDSTYAIITSTQEKTAQRPHNNLKFVVYDLKNDKLVFRDAFMDGKVKWSETYVLEANYIPGIIPKDQKKDKMGYYFNVKTLNKTEK